MSEAHSLSVNGQPQQLNEQEASQLAKELRQQLRNGNLPPSDADAIEKMVAGLGDPRGLMRLTFAESLGVVGKAAVPSLCRALSSHGSVTVRRAAAKTLTLIEDPRALPVLLEALRGDPDPVVQGSVVGAMAAVGAEAIPLLLDVLIDPESTASVSNAKIKRRGFTFLSPSMLGRSTPNSDAINRRARSELI